MKGFAMLRIGEVGWVEKSRPECGPMDAICRPLAAAVCTSDVQTAAASGRQIASIGPHTGRGFSTQPTSPILSIANPFIRIPPF